MIWLKNNNEYRNASNDKNSKYNMQDNAYSKNEEQKQSKEFFDELICYAKANIFIHLISKL